MQRFNRHRSLQVFTNGEQFYEEELAAISAAKRSINLEAYIFHEGKIGNRFVDQLAKQARNGVKANLVLDAIGEVLTGPEYFPKPQTEGEGAILVVNSTPSVGGATRSRILFQVLLASAGKSIKALEERGLISPGKGRDLSHGSKWKEWLSMCATNPECNTLAILGGVLEKFMDIEPNQEFVEKWKVDRERVARTLERTAFDATPVVESSRAGSRSLHKGCRWLSPITRLFKPPRRVDRRKRAGS